MLHAAAGEGGCAALEQCVGTMLEECTGVEGGSEQTLKDTPRVRHVGAPRPGREMEGHVETAEQEHGATEAYCHCSWMVVPSSPSLQGASTGVMRPPLPRRVSP